MIQGGADIHFLSVLLALLLLGLPTLVVPVVAGIVCGYRAGWRWGLLGYLITLIVGVAEIALYALWLLGFRRHHFLDHPLTHLEAVGELGVVLAIQIAVVLGVLWFINRRQS